MKKAYIIPEIEIIETLQEQSLLTASLPDTSHGATGDPTSETGGISNDIPGTGTVNDPYGGHGSGSGGGGNRAPGFFGGFDE